MKFQIALSVLLISAVFSATNLYVGYSSKSPNYNTIQEAVDKAASINPTSESERVTIHIAVGEYREQVIVNTPYITFMNDDTSKYPTITWYYGIGYKYYSCNSNGYYDATLAKKNLQKILHLNGVPQSKFGIKLNISKPIVLYLKIHSIVI